MPAANLDIEEPASGYTELPFPPLKKSHILHCSVHYWYPKYRSITPKARLVPLSNAFVDYLRADGIVLPPDDTSDSQVEWSDGTIDEDAATARTSRNGSETRNDDLEDSGSDEQEDDDPSLSWPETHTAIQAAISELGGKVAPKLNWSAPKDSTWINPTNSMACTTANDIYLMLKSSDFVTHDLEHWDDGCVEDEPDSTSNLAQGAGGGDPEGLSEDDPPYHLLLRKYIAIAPSVEFRCFVRRRTLLGICQRDLNHYDFLFDMMPQLRSLIQDFFDEHIANTFPDEDFVFDVYLPSPSKRVWLIDVNPWCGRTDPLLFSWLELLTMRGPEGGSRGLDDGGGEIEILPGGEVLPDGVVRLPLRLRSESSQDSDASQDSPLDEAAHSEQEHQDGSDDVDEEVFVPDFRLIKRDDPEAYSFNTPQYSAHKLPADVVEASQSGPGPLREFAEQWKEVLDEERARNGG